MLINTGVYGSRGKGLPEFTYTGRYNFSQNGENWELTLLTSGTLTFTKQGSAKTVDVFAVGGGQPGGNAGWADWAGGVVGGRAGKGGECVTKKNVRIPEVINVVIGKSNKSTEFAGITARPGIQTEPVSAWGDTGAAVYGKRGSGGHKINSYVDGINGAPGRANIGEGGDGGNYILNTANGTGGAGGTGVVKLRNARA